MLNKINERLSVVRQIIIFLPVVVITLLLGIIIETGVTNKKVYTVTEDEPNNNVEFAIAERKDTTSSWKKLNYDLYGETVDLSAQTIDCIIKNGSEYDITDWQMRINVKEECFINNAWNGTVEIHQNVLSKTTVQTLDLRDYSLDEIRLTYLYDGDLLIPLHQGDYVIYKPSASNREVILKKNTNLSIGCILYYLDYPEHTNCELTYSYAKYFWDSKLLYVVVVLAVLWAVILIVTVAYQVARKATVRDMEIKKAGIATMSNIYGIIYLIDLDTDELFPLVTNEEGEKQRPKNIPASAQIRNLFEVDSEGVYKDATIAFCEFDNVRKRLEDKDTIAFEYKSKMYGWSRIRYFAYDRKENEPLTKVLFTIQSIVDEKQEIEEIAKKVEKVEHENKAKSIFLANMSHEIRTPINTVIGFDTMILRESKDPAVRSYAKSINSAANMLLSIINGILDISKLEAEKMELVNGEYSFKNMMFEIMNMVKARSEFEKIDFKYEISPQIADRLYGDSVRIKQIIINLITNAAKYTDKGSVTFSVFGKNKDGSMHLLVSIKDTGIGIREEDLSRLTERYTRFDGQRNHSVEGTGIGLSLVKGILELMGSELHVISTYGEGSEFYFELEQKIIDDKPIGKINLEKGDFDDGEYEALFMAPDARVLVVDDNVMNLSVFKDLLKQTEIQIDTAESGAEALEKTKDEQYDLIFMDHMMPKMDGVETFKRLRSKEGINKKTPVVILTANAIKGAKEEYKQIGFDAFLSKPIQPAALEEMVLRFLDDNKVATRNLSKKEEMAGEVPEIVGVDTTYGLEHTGGMSSYISLLKQFSTVAESDLAELKSYEDKIEKNHEDTDAISNFRIKVHAMKASANIMGALQVYGVAATLEELASKGRAADILAMMPIFSDIWNNLYENVVDSLPKEKEKREVPSGDTLEALLHMLETSSSNYDIKAADDTLNKLRKFDWKDGKLKLIKELDIAVANLDAEKVQEVCEKFRK